MPNCRPINEVPSMLSGLGRARRGAAPAVVVIRSRFGAIDAPFFSSRKEIMFGTLGGPELFLILLIALIVFGPRKLPEIGKSMGKMMAEFRKASNEFRQTIESEVEAEKIREATRIDLPRS